MYLFYVDESGDPGSSNSPGTHFALSGMAIHEQKWREVLQELVVFRQELKRDYGLNLKDEIHAAEFINRPGALSRIPRYQRLEILRKCLDWMASRPHLMITTVIVDKSRKNRDVFITAWETLIQRLENTISRNNFPDPKNPLEYGLVIPDNTNGKELTLLMRRMRHFNPVSNRIDHGAGSRNLAIVHILEDPFMKDSQNSYMHQMVDVAVYFARQLTQPNSFIKQKYATKYYHRLEPILNKKASGTNPWGIVYR